MSIGQFLIAINRKSIYTNFANYSAQERTNCLNRDAALIQSHGGLRRNRKALLSDLSSLVKSARSLEHAVNDNVVTHIEDSMCDELIMKAFKAVTRAVKFLDIWVEDIVSAQGTDGRIDNNTQTKPTAQAPLAGTSESGQAEDGMQETLVPASLTTDHIDQQANCDDASLNVTKQLQEQEQTDVRPCCRRPSFTEVRQSVSGSSRQDDTTPSTQINTTSISHRPSSSTYASEASRLSLASIKLSTAHDIFLGCLGSFIGLHLESRSSSELLATTQQAVISCRNMLKIIEAIWDRDAQRSESLGHARENMYSSITDLAEAARNMFTPAELGELVDMHVVRTQKPMVDAATRCVRAAGECVAESQFVLDRLGDFHFEPLLVEFTVANAENSGPDASKSTIVECQKESQINDDALPLLEPPTRPPPPPFEEIVQPPAEVSTKTPAYDQSVVEKAPSLHVRTHSLLPPLPPFAGFLSSSEEMILQGGAPSNHGGHLRTDSFDCPSSGGSSTFIGSMRDSETSAVSDSSTRATSPEVPYTQLSELSPCDNMSLSQATLIEDFEETEVAVQQKTFVHEIVYNKDGQICGGTLPALIERLTTHDSTPDAMFVATFFLTFRLFATPIQFAQALIDRFLYVAESPRTAGPIRLRVYNVFKGWLESHWRNDCDNSALDLIQSFATRQLLMVLPTAGKRLAHLVEKVNAVEGPLVPRLVSSMGKTNTCIATYVSPDAPLPVPIITKSQLAALKAWKNSGTNINIMDFDPLELARQFTIKESRIFCSILPEELLATEWTKKTGSMAVNVRAMSTLSTDLANLVADSILQLQDSKLRAKTIKRWVKIASKCLDLANYDSLMAVICSLNSSTILRLKRTWDQVSPKTKATLETLKGIVDCSRNYAVLRQRLSNTATPCLPFVGTYLTDLTFVDVGNQTTRPLNSDDANNNVTVINFDKHVKTAKIISELQRFQIPYRLTEVPELQTWMQDQLVRVRSSDQSNLQSYYRRSLLLEPREQAPSKTLTPEPQASSSTKEKFDFFSWAHHKPADISTVTTPL